jgi:hypothetical protein
MVKIMDEERITIENYKQYVAVQENDIGEIKYLTWLQNSDGLCLTVSELVDCKCNLNEIEMLAQVEKTLYEFPVSTINCTRGEQLQEIQLNKLKNEVAIQTRRGVANKKFNNVLYYRSNIPNMKIEADSPIFVLKNGDRYGVFKHPDFNKYGFVVEYQA